MRLLVEEAWGKQTFLPSISIQKLTWDSKSQLAITYGHRLHQAHPNTWIFWIDAETTTKFEQGFRVIANELRIKGRNDKDADILNLVYEYLHNTNNGRWILILDNADDKNVFTSAPSAYYQARSDKQLRDFLPQSANGSILVTSRSRDAAYYVTCNYKHIFSVEQMTEDEAMALLRSQLDATHHEDEMKTLLKVLCYVPLAVTQAAAYISRRSLPIPDYLRELKRGNRLSTSLLEESSPQLRRDSGRSNSIIATWRVTFEYVRRNAPSAARLLSLMCLFDNQNIPEALLQGQYGEEVSAPLSNTAKEWWRRRRLHKRWRYRGAHVVKSLPCDFEDDWLMLRDYSLIKVNKDRKHFSMHPMVQFTTEKWLISRKQLDVWSPRFILIMNRNFPDSFAFASTTKDCERLFAHACAAVSYRPPSTASQSLQDWAAITYKVAGHYSTQDALEIAEKLYHVAAVGFEAALGTCTPQAMECYAQRSSRLCTLGRKPESEAIQRRVLGLQTRFLGEDHHETLETMTVLGEILASSRQESGAEELHVKVLNSRLRVLGPSHEKTQLSFQICGSHYFVHGRYEEAYTIYRQAHEGKRHDAQEKCDWEWAGKLRGMSTSLVLSGKAKDAEFHVREAISEIGKDPPGLELMKTHTQLARVLAGQGDHAGAEKHFETALQWYDAQASSHHTERIEVLRDLSMALCQLGRLDAAVDMARRCLAEGKEMYGPEHYETFAYTWILAGILEKHGDFDEALQLFRKASDGAKELLGEGHVDTTEFEADYTRLARSMAKAALGNVVEDEDTKPASER